MKRMMKWLQLPGMSLLVILASSGCKKVAPESSSAPQSYSEVITIAGSGGVSGGYADGIGKASAFKFPIGMAMDASGNVYVTDQINFCIRKITPEGIVSTFAGSGINGYLDGTGTSAQFSYLEGLFIDASGNLFVADNGNSVIRKITSAGVVTTYAGNGHSGLVDGPIATAEFSAPSGIAADKAGNIYVADNNNGVIRKITSGGIVSTYAGTPNRVKYSGTAYSGPASSAVFGPFLGGVTTDPSGNVYVADRVINFIWKITPAGIATTFAGDGATAYTGHTPFLDGLGATAEFNSPYGLSSDAAGNIYVADTDNNRIRKISQDGIVSTAAGNDQIGDVDGLVPNAELTAPLGVVTDATGSNIYFSQINLIRKINNKIISNTPINSWNNPQSWGNPR